MSLPLRPEVQALVRIRPVLEELVIQAIDRKRTSTFLDLQPCRPLRVPRLLIPDNLRTGVSRACRYDPDLNPTYQEFAMHYDVGVVPARPRHPKDKAKVEVGVQVVERWILAALRHQKFFRLADLNNAIRELLERLNQRPFRKREGSRASVFAAVERNALRALPAEPFDMSQWSYARVNIDYHIAFDANLYSVPYTLVQERVEVRATPTTIEIFHKGQRVASHVRGLLRRLNRIDVLVIDDWVMAPMAEAERRDFWEIAEDRYQTRSMILTWQLPVTRWHEQ